MHETLLRICAGLTLLFSRDFQMTAIVAQHLSMNGAHKMVIFDHRREMEGLVELKIARRGQWGFVSSCANLWMSRRR
jgi:hypothetical protein